MHVLKIDIKQKKGETYQLDKSRLIFRISCKHENYPHVNMKIHMCFFLGNREWNRYSRGIKPLCPLMLCLNCFNFITVFLGKNGRKESPIKLVTYIFRNSNYKRNVGFRPIALLDSVVHNRNRNNQTTRLVENLIITVTESMYD